jgi:chemotaxis protein methyltransferase CheR
MEGPYANLSMDAESFERLSSFVTREYGIKLPISKKPMLESRLNRKVQKLGLESYGKFVDYIFSEAGRKEELFHVIDLITTNKTDFFREGAHFQFLQHEFMPMYCRQKNTHNLKIWSAGCSTGEEPYTIAMVMEEYKKKFQATTYSIVASDISVRALQKAYEGIYNIERIAPVPLEMKRNYFLRSKADPSIVRVKPEYRSRVQYRRMNFMDHNYQMNGDFDFIFCRNVLIYFDKENQREVINKLCKQLKPGGLLFLGHSESIVGMKFPLHQLKPTVYQRHE